MLHLENREWGQYIEFFFHMKMSTITTLQATSEPKNTTHTRANGTTTISLVLLPLLD